jgi:hypothetical protein
VTCGSDKLRRELDRSADWIALARLLAKAAIDRRQKEKALMSLADLKHLAEKSAARLERITARAAKHDARGEEIESRSNHVLDEHDAVFDTLDDSFNEIEKFNSDMRAQLGNEPRKPVAASPKPGEQPKPSVNGEVQTVAPADVTTLTHEFYGDGTVKPKGSDTVK